FEAGILGGVFASAGAVFGAVCALAIDAAQIRVPISAMRAVLLSDVIHLSVDWTAVLYAILGFTVVTVIAALWPAIQASRMQPVTAIHHVG
ncbi:MAG: FtsX-like permease family protein, partial [Myxococcota bacterium]